MHAAFSGVSGETFCNLIVHRQAITPRVHGVFHQPPPFWLASRAILAGQQPAAQGTVRDETDLLRLRQRQYFDFGLAFDQVVHGLDALKACQPLAGRDAQCLGDLPGGPIAHRRIQDFALVHQIVQGAQCLIHWRV